MSALPVPTRDNLVQRLALAPAFVFLDRAESDSVGELEPPGLPKRRAVLAAVNIEPLAAVAFGQC